MTSIGYNVGMMMILRVAALTALVFLCECISLAQQAPVTLPRVTEDGPAPSVLDKRVIPLDLTHVDHPSCVLVEYEVGESLNAQTHEVEHLTQWRVEPFATYDDHRERWELPQEKLRYSNELRPGALSVHLTSGAALDACQAWIKKVKAAIIEEHHRQSHGAPKVKEKL